MKNLAEIDVIIMKPQKPQPEGELKIEYQERLEHDAANILNQPPSFSSILKGGNYGFDPVFRGFKYDQLNVVMNGAQGATAACPNRMDPPTSQEGSHWRNPGQPRAFSLQETAYRLRKARLSRTQVQIFR